MEKRSNPVTALDEHRLNRRQLMQGTAAAGAAAALAGGVTLAPSFGSGASAQSAPGALQIGRETEYSAVFVPVHASNGTQTQVFDLCYSRLLKVKDDLSFQPDLAESYDVSPDATTYTFKLRQGVTWHDGTPLTGNDIVFTYKLNLTKATGALASGKLKQIKGAAAFYDGTATDIEGLQLTDDTTLVITLEKPNVAFLTGTAGSNSLVWILPEHIYKDADPATIDQFPASQAPTVGSGAYQFVEYSADQYISFKANPNYHLGAPKIEQVFIRLAEPATQLAQLESGELHMMSRMAAKEAKRLETSDVLNIVNTPGVGIFQPAINNERVPDKRVRQAMMYGCDRKSLLDAVLFGQGQLDYQTVIGPDWVVYDDLNPYEFDQEKAKSLLAEAGWDSSKSLQLTWPKGNQNVELAAPVFQQQMDEIGIKIELFPQESAAYVKAVVTEPDFDMAWFGGGSYRLDPDVSSTYYLTVNFTPAGGNTTHYSNPDLDELFIEGRGTTDIPTRQEIYHKVATTLNEDVPTIFWWSDNQIFGINKKLQGVKPGPNQYIWWNIQEWSFSE